jgi:hypothetical protein
MDRIRRKSSVHSKKSNRDDGRSVKSGKEDIEMQNRKR